jgi:hypothetical protein
MKANQATIRGCVCSALALLFGASVFAQTGKTEPLAKRGCRA